jgi:hypothetical protein
MLSQPVNYYIRNIFLAIGFAGRILEGIGAGMVQTGGKEISYFFMFLFSLW